MSRYDDLRARREAAFEAKAKRALGNLEPKPVTEIPIVRPVTENTVTENVTENRKRGRPCKSDALSNAEPQRRHRTKFKSGKPGNENAQ